MTLPFHTRNDVEFCYCCCSCQVATRWHVKETRLALYVLVLVVSPSLESSRDTTSKSFICYSCVLRITFLLLLFSFFGNKIKYLQHIAAQTECRQPWLSNLRCVAPPVVAVAHFVQATPANHNNTFLFGSTCVIFNLQADGIKPKRNLHTVKLYALGGKDNLWVTLINWKYICCKSRVWVCFGRCFNNYKTRLTIVWSLTKHIGYCEITISIKILN